MALYELLIGETTVENGVCVYLAGPDATYCELIDWKPAPASAAHPGPLPGLRGVGSPAWRSQSGAGEGGALAGAGVTVTEKIQVAVGGGVAAEDRSVRDDLGQLLAQAQRVAEGSGENPVYLQGQLAQADAVALRTLVLGGEVREMDADGAAWQEEARRRLELHVIRPGWWETVEEVELGLAVADPAGAGAVVEPVTGGVYVANGMWLAGGEGQE